MNRSEPPITAALLTLYRSGEAVDRAQAHELAASIGGAVLLWWSRLVGADKWIDSVDGDLQELEMEFFSLWPRASSGFHQDLLDHAEETKGKEAELIMWKEAYRVAVVRFEEGCDGP